MTDQETPQPAKQRRSPGFPSIDLRTALERTRDLYRVAPKHPVPMTAAAEEWGYSPKSSSNLITAAALKRYGLVRDVGSSKSRQLALTEEGRELAFLDQDRDSSPRWAQLVRDAALRPKIHRQVLDHFDGPLPDDRVVLQYLLFDLGFVDETAAKSFLRQLRSTLDFAGVDGPELTVPATVELSDDDGPPAPDAQVVSASPAPAVARPAGPIKGDGFTLRPEPQRPPEPTIYDNFRADRTLVQIPYSAGEWAQLRARFPMSEREWEAMIAMLQAMKPGLVLDESQQAADKGQPG